MERGACKAINLGANVSNFGVGYAFNSNCNPSHPLVIQVQWIDAVGNILNDTSAWLPPGQAGTWLTYSGNLQRPHDTRQTARACIWVTQDVIGWLGGPLLTSGCFLRNS